MPKIRLTAFTGEQPRLVPRLLPDTGAKAAVNVRLDDGGLTPIRASVQTGQAGDADHKTIYRHLGEWLSWSGVINAVPGPVADDRLYITGDGVPKVRIEDTVYPLAVPRPTVALTATPTGTGTGDVQSRVYVYTWVTEFGEESEPSPASEIIDWQPGKEVDLSGFASTPSGRGISKQRIYRSQTGSVGTFFYLIHERTASSGDYTDDVAVDQFQEPLPSSAWAAPPDDLQGLVAMPNGMMAAFTGRQLYFCEPYRPHAWPEAYVLTTDSEIVALGAIGTSLVVATKGNPHLASGATPLAMQMVKLQTNLPCINPRSLVDMGSVICYASHEGLVAVGPDGGAGLITGNLFNRDGWLRFDPATIVAGQHAGRYVFWYDTTDENGVILEGAAMIDIGNAPFLIRAGGAATAAFYDLTDGGLYFTPKGELDIFRLDSPDGEPAIMYWRSKEFHLPHPDNFGAILIEAKGTLTGEEQDALFAAKQAAIDHNEDLIEAGSILGDIAATFINDVPFAGDTLQPMPYTEAILQVGIYADGVRVAQIDRTNRPLRLPAGFRARRWEIDVSGNVRAEQITMAGTMDELKGGDGQRMA